MSCLCGDPACPSCGSWQGTYLGDIVPGDRIRLAGECEWCLVVEVFREKGWCTLQLKDGREVDREQVEEIK